MRETTSISFLGIKEETGKYVRSALYELLKRIMFTFTSSAISLLYFIMSTASTKCFSDNLKSNVVASK